MTPKKDIVRKPTYTLPDGTRLTAHSLGPGFTLKETAFIVWYTHPGTESFLNAGRAAVRAGYNPANAVAQGYLLKRKPRIAKKIKELIIPVKEQLHDLAWMIADLSADRMFFNIFDFYRPCKRIVKIHGQEQEINSMEAIPLNEISERNRMCIDAVDIKTIGGKDEAWYKLPNREKASKTFFKCLEIITGKSQSQIISDVIYGKDIFRAENEDATYEIIHEDVKTAPIKESIPNWRKTAEFTRGYGSKL